MAINFPTSLDTLTNPTGWDNLDTVGVVHSDQHSNVNDAIEALEAKVGIDGSAVTTSHDYKLSWITWAYKAVSTATTTGTNTGDQTDATLTFSDITTNNASSTKHWFLPKLSNISSDFLNGQGNWATPSGTTNSYLSTSFTAQTSVTVTHNFGAYPIVQVFDNTGAVFIPLTITHSSTSAFTMTFTSSTTGTIIASVGSPQPQTLITVTDNYTILTTDQIVLCTAASKTMTLPTAVGNSGKIFIITNGSSGDITVDANGSETISGELTQTLAAGDSIDVFSNGTNYYIK